MPGVEDHISQNKLMTPSGEVDVNPNDEQPVVRELTQTDRLNQRLLKQFLSRMNSGDVGAAFGAPPQDPNPSPFDE